MLLVALAAINVTVESDGTAVDATGLYNLTMLSVYPSVIPGLELAGMYFSQLSSKGNENKCRCEMCEICEMLVVVVVVVVVA